MHAHARSAATGAGRGLAMAGLIGALALAAPGVQAIGADARLAQSQADSQASDAVVGFWSGTLTGDPQLPPEGAPFTMTLELDEQGAITGTFESGEFILDVEDAVYNEEEQSFTCRLVTWLEGEEIAADLLGAVENVDMEGSVTADGFAADFTASKG